MQILQIVLMTIGLLLLLIIALIFTVRVRVVFSYKNNDGFDYAVSLLGIKLLGGDKQKRDTEKVKISDYSDRRMRKRQRKTAKAKQKMAKKSTSDDSKPSGIDFSLVFSVIKHFFLPLIKKYAKKLDVRAERLYITIATDDAAKTAILYGTVMQGVAYILAVIDNYTNLRRLKEKNISVTPDFTAETTTVDLRIVFYAPLLCILDAYIRYLKMTYTNSASKN